VPDSLLRVLGIPGSLRAGSFNRLLLENAPSLAPQEVEIIPFEKIGEIPWYNADLDQEGLRPAVVEELKAEIEAADALLFVTPEYNHGIPGVLKNAIDWVSRPAFRSPLAGKPVGVMGAASGLFGAVRAQDQLKVVLGSTLALVMNHRGVAVGNARDRFDEAGRLTDERTQQAVTAYLEALAAWTRRVQPPVTEGVYQG